MRARSGVRTAGGAFVQGRENALKIEFVFYNFVTVRDGFRSLIN